MPSNLLLTKIGTAILQLAARVGATGGSGYVRPKDRGRQTVGPSVMPSPLRCTPSPPADTSAPEALTLVNSSVVCADRGALTAYLVDDHGTYLESVWASVHRHDITMTAAAENELENERGGADGCAGKTFLSQVSQDPPGLLISHGRRRRRVALPVVARALRGTGDADHRDRHRNRRLGWIPADRGWLGKNKL